MEKWTKTGDVQRRTGGIGRGEVEGIEEKEGGRKGGREGGRKANEMGFADEG